MIVDAGPLYALVDRADPDHEACRALLETEPGPLIVPTMVLAEVTYLIEQRLGATAEIELLGDLAAGTLIAEPVEPADWIPIAELVGRYRDLPLGAADASVAVAANRLGDRTIATLDRRHFEVIRPELPGVTLVP